MSALNDSRDFLTLPDEHSEDFVKRFRKNLKMLGISPSVDNGIRQWRVIWRPFLSQPVSYQKLDGSWDRKEKADNVCSRRFPITADTTEAIAYREAAHLASQVYRKPLPDVQPIVDWEALARDRGVKLRDRFAKPALNGAREQAAEMLREGYGLQRVAQELGVHPSTVSRWRSRLRKEKALQ